VYYQGCQHIIHAAQNGVCSKQIDEVECTFNALAYLL
jgi:hypothetical protein